MASLNEESPSCASGALLARPVGTPAVITANAARRRLERGQAKGSECDRAEPAVSLGEMAGGIAHDFRNVLAVINSALHLAERNAADPKKTAAYLAAARESVEQGSKLVSRLLTLARPEEPSGPTEDLISLITRLAPFLEFGAGPKIKLTLDLCDGSARCAVDPTRFRAVLLNLVFNARDAMPDGGDLGIEAGLAAGEPRWFRVAVIDSGHGMTAATLSHIFDRWFTTKQGSGTGLGLPQVRAFMQGLGGRVRVASEPGSGTSFELLFPMPHRPDQAASKKAIENWVNEGGSL